MSKQSNLRGVIEATAIVIGSFVGAVVIITLLIQKINHILQETCIMIRQKSKALL